MLQQRPLLQVLFSYSLFCILLFSLSSPMPTHCHALNSQIRCWARYSAAVHTLSLSSQSVCQSIAIPTRALECQSVCVAWSCRGREVLTRWKLLHLFKLLLSCFLSLFICVLTICLFFVAAVVVVHAYLCCAMLQKVRQLSALPYLACFFFLLFFIHRAGAVLRQGFGINTPQALSVAASSLEKKTLVRNGRERVTPPMEAGRSYTSTCVLAATAILYKRYIRLPLLTIRIFLHFSSSLLCVIFAFPLSLSLSVVLFFWMFRSLSLAHYTYFIVPPLDFYCVALVWKIFYCAVLVKNSTHFFLFEL